MNELIQGTPEWLEARKGFITATDAPIIMGLSPWKTPYKLFRQKMDLDPPDEETDVMRRGTMMEGSARLWLEDQRKIRCDPKVVFKDFMMASLDGLTPDNIVVEIKCGDKSYKQAIDEEIPEYYYAQIQHQIECSNAEKALYVAFNGQTGIIIPIERDQEFINEMTPKLREFYECLLQYTPPTMTTKDYHQRSDLQWNKLAESYQKAYRDRKNAERLEEHLKQELILLSGGQSSMGAGIRLSRIPRKGVIDYSKIKEIQELDLEPYRKESTEYWKVGID